MEAFRRHLSQIYNGAPSNLFSTDPSRQQHHLVKSRIFARLAMLSLYDVGLTLIAIAALPLAYILQLWLRPAYREKRYSRLPPGPEPHWLYGTELPTLYPWRYFEKWTQQYQGSEKDSGLITIWKGREPIVVVGRVRP